MPEASRIFRLFSPLPHNPTESLLNETEKQEAGGQTPTGMVTGSKGASVSPFLPPPPAPHTVVDAVIGEQQLTTPAGSRARKAPTGFPEGVVSAALTVMRHGRGPGAELGAAGAPEKHFSQLFHFQHEAPVLRAAMVLEVALVGRDKGDSYGEKGPDGEGLVTCAEGAVCPLSPHTVSLLTAM